MKTYNLTALITMSIQTQVEANSLQEAIEIADQRQDILHGHFQHGNPMEHWVYEDVDGMPQNIKEDD